MKKRCWFFVVLGLLVFSLEEVVYGWQGRMAGMGDPFGLVEDESDFLIHPSKIINGQGIKFYGDYRFTYSDVKHWDYALDWFDPDLVDISARFPFESSGDEEGHDALLGVALPFGSGRFGLFFQYTGSRWRYEGQEQTQGFPFIFTSYFDLDRDLDAFDLRFLYGLPIGTINLGGEIQLAYRQEDNRTFYDEWALHTFLTNSLFGAYSSPSTNLFPYMFPYDSKYWEALFKGSIERMIGHTNFVLTTRGGFIFEGKNKLGYSEVQIPTFTPPTIWAIDMGGDVKGWSLGGDVFLRYPIASNLSFPSLLKIEYQKKNRDGDGFSRYNSDVSGISYYRNRENKFQLEVGGGLDKEFHRGTRIAGGFYYRFLQNQNDFFLNILSIDMVSWEFYDYNKYPDHSERQVILRLAAEKQFSSVIAMRIGTRFSYGWIQETLKFSFGSSTLANSTDKISLDGFRWGIGVSLGATMEFNGFTIEPFANGGYQKMDLNGEGITTRYPTHLEMDMLRKEWSIGGGLSIKF